jgi:hypothetical protein
LSLGFDWVRRIGCVPWYIPVIPVFGRQDSKFKASLVYTVRPFVKKKKNQYSTGKLDEWKSVWVENKVESVWYR